jgi:sugar phosphate isomerase/epimerase
MYTGVRDVIVFQAGFSTLMEGLSALEIDALELMVDRDLRVASLTGERGEMRLGLRDADASLAMQDHYGEYGVRVSGLLLANNFNAEDRQAEIDWVSDTVRAADALGIEAVRIDSAMTAQQELPLASRIDIFASACEQALTATEGCRASLGIENHGFQGNDPAWLQGVLDQVASPRLGVCLDTGNFYWAGHPLSRVYELIEQFAPRVVTTHVKNIAFPEDKREVQRELGWGYGDYVVPIYQGDIDHHRVVEILAAAGYRGGLNIEDESLGKYSEGDRKQVLRRNADYLSGIICAHGGTRCYAH